MKENIEGFHLFKLEVMATQLPNKWKWPNMIKYESSSNSEAHAKVYLTQVRHFSEDSGVHCHLFSMTLTGLALERYYSLPINSIDSLTFFWQGS